RRPLQPFSCWPPTTRLIDQASHPCTKKCAPRRKWVPGDCKEKTGNLLNEGIMKFIGLTPMEQGLPILLSDYGLASIWRKNEKGVMPICLECYSSDGTWRNRSLCRGQRS